MRHQRGHALDDIAGDQVLAHCGRDRIDDDLAQHHDLDRAAGDGLAQAGGGAVLRQQQLAQAPFERLGVIGKTRAARG